MIGRGFAVQRKTRLGGFFVGGVKINLTPVPWVLEGLGVPTHKENMYSHQKHIQSKNVPDACPCGPNIDGSPGEVAGGIVSTPEPEDVIRSPRPIC